MLYCFTISIVNNNFISLNSAFNRKIDIETKGNGFPFVSINVSCHDSQSESLTNSFNNIPHTTINKTFNTFVAIIKCREQLIANYLTQYTSFSINFIIRYRKANIIFPFHYFW